MCKGDYHFSKFFSYTAFVGLPSVIITTDQGKELQSQTDLNGIDCSVQWFQACNNCVTLPARIWWRANYFHIKLWESNFLIFDQCMYTWRIWALKREDFQLFVTRWVKSRHIPHFMQIEIRLEIGILMSSCTPVKKWKRLFVWFSSCGVKRFTDVEHNYLKKPICCYGKF